MVLDYCELREHPFRVTVGSIYLFFSAKLKAWSKHSRPCCPKSLGSVWSNPLKLHSPREVCSE